MSARPFSAPSIAPGPFLEAHSGAAVVREKVDPLGLERPFDLGHGRGHGPDGAIGALHALHRREMDARPFGELPRRPAQQAAGGANLL